MSARTATIFPSSSSAPAYRKSGEQFYVHAYHRWSRGNDTPQHPSSGPREGFYEGPEAPALDASITDGEGALASGQILS